MDRVADLMSERAGDECDQVEGLARRPVTAAGEGTEVNRVTLFGRGEHVLL